jgi:hypothetical protein
MISRMFKLFILFFAFIFSVTPGFSQSVKPVTIIVSGTAYDDPGFTALKDVLKNNPDVKSLKTAFNNNIATLTFTYKNEADELWDNIAAQDKARFKILSVDSKTIKLQQLKGTAATAAKTNSDKNCGCDYFPLCNYDKTRSFMGQTWKGLDNNGKITYYQCAGGVLKAKFELFDNFEGTSLGFATFTALKYNEPKGASWKETVDVNGAKYYYEHVIIHKDISITAGGKEYKNAMKVRRMLSAASIFYQGQPQNLMQIENSHTYYVKDVGAFPEKGVVELAEEKTETEIKPNTDVNSKDPLFNELTKEDWHFEKTENLQMDRVISLRKDGSYNYSISGINNDGYWRIVGNSLEFKYGKNAKTWTKAFDIVTTAGKITELKELAYSNFRYKHKSDIKQLAPESSITPRNLIAVWKGQYKLYKVDGKAVDRKADWEIIYFDVLARAVEFQKWNSSMLFATKVCQGTLSVTGDESNFTMFIKDCSGNNLQVDKKSVPGRKLFLGNKEYTYYQQ